MIMPAEILPDIISRQISSADQNPGQKNQPDIYLRKFKIDDLAKSRFAPFYSTGEEISSPAIRNKFGWFHPHLRPGLIRARPVDGLFASPSKFQ